MPDFAFLAMSSHCAVSRATSRAQLLLGGTLGGRAHDDAGALGHDVALRISLSRVRSVSGSLRLMPVIEPSGT